MNLLFPQGFKFKKTHKIKLKINNKLNKLDLLSFNNLPKYGLKASESGLITARQIEAARKAIIKDVKRLGKGSISIKIFPYHSLTKKPAEVRMGKGKGNHHVWVCPVRAGKVLFEISGPLLKFNIAHKSFLIGSAKLPIQTKFLYNKIPNFFNFDKNLYVNKINYYTNDLSSYLFKSYR